MCVDGLRGPLRYILPGAALLPKRLEVVPWMALGPAEASPRLLAELRAALAHLVQNPGAEGRGGLLRQDGIKVQRSRPRGFPATETASQRPDVSAQKGSTFREESPQAFKRPAGGFEAIQCNSRSFRD